jgi:hypothetical protein
MRYSFWTFLSLDFTSCCSWSTISWTETTYAEQLLITTCPFNWEVNVGSKCFFDRAKEWAHFHIRVLPLYFNWGLKYWYLPVQHAFEPKHKMFPTARSSCLLGIQFFLFNVLLRTSLTTRSTKAICQPRKRNCE